MSHENNKPSSKPILKNESSNSLDLTRASQATQKTIKKETQDGLAVEFDSKTFLSHLTSKPGVYQMYDSEGHILYVGKAKNLKKRVSSYFQKTGLNVKTLALVRRIMSIEVTVTPSEAEALVLEHNLIKSQKPPFNIQLRDDKSFPYIFMSTGEDFPRLALHRGPKRKKGKYFGPYPNSGAVRESLNFLQKTFHVRQCEDSVFSNRSRPCLLYQINRCSGPCVDVISKENYEKDLEQTRLFLDGKSKLLNDRLSRDMEGASQNLAFEQAAIYRDRIKALSHVQAQQVIDSSGASNMDVIACACGSGVACIHVLYVRHGRIVGSKSYFPKDKLERDESALLNAFVSHNYIGGSAMDMPGSIAVSHSFEDEGLLSDALTAQLGRSLKVSSNVRTYKAKWLTMALEASRQNLTQRLNDKRTVTQRFLALKNVLRLEELPQRIECFDISHSSGELTVASCVVFDQDGARKSDYRRFNIDGITGGDDYAAMHQALTRRYTRLQKEEKSLPDILLIDGGKGQLSQARGVFEDLGIDQVFLMGVAKGTTRKAGFETLIHEDGTEHVLSADDPSLHLIQQVRDEAHRFAVTGHKNRRDKARRTSSLEGIPGIGPKRRRELLNHFGGLQEVNKASAADLAKVPGLSKKMAEEVYSALHTE